MSKVKLYASLVTLILLGQSRILLAETNLVATDYNDPNWVLVVSDTILRENLCDEQWYEKVFNLCYLDVQGVPTENRAIIF